MQLCIKYPVVGVIGYEIFIKTGVDLAEATEVLIHYKKPSGAVGSWTAASYVNDDGDYGALYVTESADDLDEASTNSATWQLQVGVDMPAFVGRGAIAKLKVLEALPDPA